ncbi:HD domain-containing protein [Clostridium sp. KNHs214]|uniref:HD domain-containing protein n=1 Tax=Clostridium sp. KNHs214 TaxID=1540257 RepID=UPI000558CB45|nr:HD domain-containing protein [Clostridium sp. KNHs214]
MKDIFEVKERIINLLKSTEREGIDKVIKYLEETDFFVAPASTKYHGNYEGGLAEHSLNVCILLEKKNRQFDLGLAPDTIAITALLHDICKVNLYHKCTKNRKNEKTQKWESYQGYGFEDTFPVGHGEKSIIKLQQFIRLSKDENLMIRWHMGAANENWANMNAMSASFNMCRGALALHTADMEASYLLEEHFEPGEDRNQMKIKGV